MHHAEPEKAGEWRVMLRTLPRAPSRGNDCEQSKEANPSRSFKVAARVSFASRWGHQSVRARQTPLPSSDLLPGTTSEPATLRPHLPSPAGAPPRSCRQAGRPATAQMSVDIERCRDACVPKSGLDLLRVGTPFPDSSCPPCCRGTIATLGLACNREAIV